VAQDQYFRGSNKVGNGTIFLSFFILPTVDSNQKSGPKKFSVFSTKTFFSKEYLMTNEYAFCSTLIHYYARCYLTYFALNVTMKTRTEEINFCRVAVDYAFHQEVQFRARQ
jgi:hypothetical protein